jgi:endoglucanase
MRPADRGQVRRPLLLALLALLAAPAGAGAAVLEAEAMTVPAGTGGAVADAAASGGAALGLWTATRATGRLTTGAPAQALVLRVRGQSCGGAPTMDVVLDGRVVARGTPVGATAWTDVRIATSAAPGTHAVEVAFLVDKRTAKCDRNLWVDRLELPEAAAPAVGNPFADRPLWVDPDSNARRTADGWRASRPADAAAMDEIANASQADWFVGWSGDVRAAVDARVDQITGAGALPVLVAYDIPYRDCGEWSAGGQTGADAYRSWIRAFAEGIGDRRAVVVLEPDALVLTRCLTEEQRLERVGLLREAIDVLAARPGVAVYLDAGNADWMPAADTAARLREVGLDRARGFALNTSTTIATERELAHGLAVSDLVGSKPFVIDTSRNGVGSNGEWCNPLGRALGARPGSPVPDPRVDALLWVKRPGESDGLCNGGPAAGTWWPEYALGLAQRALP